MAITAHFEDTPGRPREPRRTLRLEALGTLASGEASGVTIHNVSSNGLLLETEDGLEVGEALTIDLPLAGPTRARVIWSSGDLHGCAFDKPVSPATLSAAQLRSAVTSEENQTPGREESFGARLHRLRKEQGLSQSDIANRLGVSKPTVWAWEQGRAKPIGSRIATLAQALGVSEQQLTAVHERSSLDAVMARAREEVSQAFGVRVEQVKITIEI
jgi:transcriptional regulator with XRE-family HTH domain